MEKTVFYCVYILESKVDTAHFYTGFTENLENRLKDHNSGKNPHTAEHKPWRIKTAVAFTNRQKALGFERYLKTNSGRTFAKNRLKTHNQSKDPHTAKYKPWKIKTAIAFTDRERDLEFECYLKWISAELFGGRGFHKSGLEKRFQAHSPRTRYSTIGYDFTIYKA